LPPEILGIDWPVNATFMALSIINTEIRYAQTRLSDISPIKKGRYE
jgi:hypothetical protein